MSESGIQILGFAPVERGEAIRRLALAYRDSEVWQIPVEVVENFRDQVEHWYAKIPARIRYVCDKMKDGGTNSQPFNSVPEMEHWLKSHGELLMLSEASEALGRDLYTKHRAVHDWFGHIVPGNQFGGVGEAHAFKVHKSQYTGDVLPIVFSDVVLANAYWEHVGSPWEGERFVCREDLYPVAAFL